MQQSAIEKVTEKWEAATCPVNFQKHLMILESTKAILTDFFQREPTPEEIVAYSNNVFTQVIMEPI